MVADLDNCTNAFDDLLKIFSKISFETFLKQFFVFIDAIFSMHWKNCYKIDKESVRIAMNKINPGSAYTSCPERFLVFDDWSCAFLELLSKNPRVD